jgi:hypothetical protein
MKRRPRQFDPMLRTQPWKIYSVFDPIERVLHRMESEGTIDAAGGVAVFHEDSKGGWYEIVPAIEGIIEFHQIAQSRYGLPCDISGLSRLAKKLDHSAPIFPADIAAARASINSCKQQAMTLRQSQATDIIETVRISMALDNIKGSRHAAHA